MCGGGYIKISAVKNARQRNNTKSEGYMSLPNMSIYVETEEMAMRKVVVREDIKQPPTDRLKGMKLSRLFTRLKRSVVKQSQQRVDSSPIGHREQEAFRSATLPFCFLPSPK